MNEWMNEWTNKWQLTTTSNPTDVDVIALDLLILDQQKDLKELEPYSKARVVMLQFLCHSDWEEFPSKKKNHVTEKLYKISNIIGKLPLTSLVSHWGGQGLGHDNP